jgi:hypothetical protein
MEIKSDKQKDKEHLPWKGIDVVARQTSPD